MASAMACWRPALVAGLIALASCTSPDTSKVCSFNGETYICPSDTQCGAAQRLCVKPGGCGNGIVDESEQCDDGNKLAGDGCSPTCQREECGNGVKDPGEICDDGNTKGGDGCSADCKSAEVCGNGIVDRDAGEVCDDGVNDGKGGVTLAKSGDGCSANCRSTEVCGNHIIDDAVGEVCDDGPLGSVACSTNCRSNLSCGNRTVDTGEECDHGNLAANNLLGNDNANDCRHDCQFNRCGDGMIDAQPGSRFEECDDGHLVGLVPTPTETVDCNLDCTSRHCGDGKLNRAAGEQCDDHNTSDGDGCSHDCQFERCGNNVVDIAVGEQCDGVAGPQPCNLATCFLEVCGNGTRDDDNRTAIHEECDDHNTSDNDGCSHDCKIEFCGDGKKNNHEACDPTDPLFGAAGCNSDCTLPVCGDSKLNTAAGEQCDDGNTTPGDGCSATCQNERCGNGTLDPHEQCDGLLGLQPCNTATCVQEICGNGILDQDAAQGVHEQCDDGNADPGDGCSATCQFERCGNGVTDPGEQCDDGDDNTDTPTCAYNDTCTSCTTSCRSVALNPHCGDGIVDSGSEVCDDGNADACGSCSASCGQVTSSQAIGFILATPGGALNDGETFTLDDGINPPTVFEFQAVDVLHAGLTGGNVIISFAGTDTAAVIGEAIAAAILQRHTDGLLLIAPVIDPKNTNDALVLLRHDRFTVLGNQQITSTVSSAAFFTIGMAGGLGGDCGDGTGCKRDADCASNFCDTSAHACATPPGLHLASRAH